MSSTPFFIHRFWAGGEMPDDYKEFGRRWGELNPDAYVVDWGLEVLDDLPTELSAVVDHLFFRDNGQDGVELFVQIADVVGYWLVCQYGGAYFNCDMEPLKPLAGELPDLAWASLENNSERDIVNAAFGAPVPQDPFWGGLISALPSSYFADPFAEMVLTTGPRLLTTQAREHPELIHVFPVETFNSVHWSQIEVGGDARSFTPPPTALAVHHWGHKKDRRSNVVETGTQR